MECQNLEVDLPAKVLLNKAFAPIFLKGLVGYKIHPFSSAGRMEEFLSSYTVAETTCNLKYIDVSLGAFEEVH